MPTFSASSKANLAQCLPQLQAIANEAIKEIDFKVLQGMRSYADQAKALASGNSKVYPGHSAHNWKPAVAFDLFPAPYDWNNHQAFIDLSKVILAMPAKLGLKDLDGNLLKLRWGGDFNMDGNKTTNDAWDPGHYELYPWRDWAKKYSQPYKG